MTHQCTKCNTDLVLNENWVEGNVRQHKYLCITCSTKLNETRMFVNGKYVPYTHPMHKAGRYKSFNDAAFSSFEKYKKSKDGYVYAITNPAWEGWVKIGMAVDADDRCKSYQTSSPLRDYKLEHCTYFEDRRRAEHQAHKKAEEIAEECGSEWFKIPVDEAVKIIGDLK